jgi:hypothetical protein
MSDFVGFFDPSVLIYTILASISVKRKPSDPTHKTHKRRNTRYLIRRAGLQHEDYLFARAAACHSEHCFPQGDESPDSLGQRIPFKSVDQFVWY